MDIAKYLLLLLSNLLAFAGAWVFSFAENRKDSDRKKLTPAGKIALPMAVCLLIGGFVMMILDDRRKADAAAAAKKVQQETAQIMGLALLPQSAARDAQLENLLHSAGLSEPSALGPELAKALSLLERTLGGRQAQLNALASAGVGLPTNRDDVLLIATFDLRLFGRSQSDDPDDNLGTREAVLRVLRGLDADIVTVQEIADFHSFQDLLKGLPQYGWAYGGSDPLLTQAVLFRRDRITQLGAPILLPNDDQTFARRPIVSQFEARSLKFDLLAVHLKSQFGPDRGVHRRLREATKISAWLQQHRSRPLIFIGRLQVPADAPEIAPIVDAGVTFVSAELPEDATTLISDQFGPLVMTHIGAANGMEQNYLKGSLRIHSLTSLMPGFPQKVVVETISDNNPVTAAFRLVQ